MQIGRKDGEALVVPGIVTVEGRGRRKAGELVSETEQTYVTHLGRVDAQIALMLPAASVCVGLERISETEIEG